MKKHLVAGVLCLVAAVAVPHASAATVGDVAAALAAPANASQATNEWTAFAKLSGAKWQGNAPKRGGNAYYWNAKMPIDGVGPGEVALVGSQKLVQSATVNWPKDIELAKVPQLLSAESPNVHAIRTSARRLSGRSGVAARASIAQRCPGASRSI